MPPAEIPGDQPSPVPPILGYAQRQPPPMIAVIWCRLFALWMLANALNVAASVIGMVAFRVLFVSSRMLNSYSIELLPSAFPAIVWFILAWYCWRKAPSLASRLTDSSGPETPHPSLTPADLLNVMLIGVGVYMLTSGLPTVVQFAFLIFQNVRNVPNGVNYNQFTGSMLASIARCILGIWLIVGKAGFARLIQSHSGRWKTPSAQPDFSSSDEVNKDRIF